MQTLVARLQRALSEAIDRIAPHDMSTEQFRRWRALTALDPDEPQLKAPHGELKPKEIAVLELLIDGKSNKQISGLLGIGLRTVELRRSGLMRKFGATSQVHLGVLVERYRHADSVTPGPASPEQEEPVDP